LSSDDGSRLYLNGTLVINGWVDQSATERNYTTYLYANSYIPMIVEYYENTGQAVVQFSWKGPFLTKQTVPAAALFRRK
jgi:hypothetical protein